MEDLSLKKIDKENIDIDRIQKEFSKELEDKIEGKVIDINNREEETAKIIQSISESFIRYVYPYCKRENVDVDFDYQLKINYEQERQIFLIQVKSVESERVIVDNILKLSKIEEDNLFKVDKILSKVRI